MEGRPDQVPNGQRVFAGRLTDAHLDRDRAASCYTLVSWRGRHVAEPTDLTEAESCGYSSEVRRISRTIAGVWTHGTKLPVASMIGPGADVAAGPRDVISGR